MALGLTKTSSFHPESLAGISDHKQRLCFALALWNGKDPILKERLFGLTNCDGNHGEDVKAYYFYLDSTPTPVSSQQLLELGLAAAFGARTRRKAVRPVRTSAS